MNNIHSNKPKSELMVCNVCKQYKPIHLMTKDTSCKCGYRKQCKECRAKQARDKRAPYLKHPYRIKNNTFYENGVTVIRCPKCGDKIAITGKFHGST